MSRRSLTSLGGRFEFLCVGSREPHPGDGAPWAEDPIGYANHRVDDAEVPHVAQDYPELFAVWPMDNDLLADPRFGYAILRARANPLWYIPVRYGYTPLLVRCSALYIPCPAVFGPSPARVVAGQVFCERIG